MSPAWPPSWQEKGLKFARAHTGCSVVPEHIFQTSSSPVDLHVRHTVDLRFDERSKNFSPNGFSWMLLPLLLLLLSTTGEAICAVQDRRHRVECRVEHTTGSPESLRVKKKKKKIPLIKEASCFMNTRAKTHICYKWINHMGGQIERHIFPGSGGALSDGLQKGFISWHAY